MQQTPSTTGIYELDASAIVSTILQQLKKVTDARASHSDAYYEQDHVTPLDLQRKQKEAKKAYKKELSKLESMLCPLMAEKNRFAYCTMVHAKDFCDKFSGLAKIYWALRKHVDNELPLINNSKQMLCKLMGKLPTLPKDDPYYRWLTELAIPQQREEIITREKKFDTAKAEMSNTRRKMNDLREKYISYYGYTILSWSLIFEIAYFIIQKRITNVIEVMAGRGYMTYFVNVALEFLQNGSYDTRVVASDLELGDNNKYFGANSPHNLMANNAPISRELLLTLDATTHITQAKPKMMIMSWPPYNESGALDALDAFVKNGGKYFMYFGEPMGCCGDELFNTNLKSVPKSNITNIRVKNWDYLDPHNEGVIYMCKKMKVVTSTSATSASSSTSTTSTSSASTSNPMKKRTRSSPKKRSRNSRSKRSIPSTITMSAKAFTKVYCPTIGSN